MVLKVVSLYVCMVEGLYVRSSYLLISHKKLYRKEGRKDKTDSRDASASKKENSLSCLKRSHSLCLQVFLNLDQA